MGREAICRARFDGATHEGKLLLETDELLFRGPPRLAIALGAITKVEARTGELRVRHPGGLAVFELGDAAASWAERIANPPGLADKLGVKPGSRVSLVGKLDAALRKELERADVATRLRSGSDLVFLAANDRKVLGRLAELAGSLAEKGAIWVVRPKGSDAISEKDVRDAARASGLVDVKVVRISGALTGEKLTRRSSRA